jgi:hypothetical protein
MKGSLPPFGLCPTRSASSPLVLPSLGYSHREYPLGSPSFRYTSLRRSPYYRYRTIGYIGHRISLGLYFIHLRYPLDHIHCYRFIVRGHIRYRPLYGYRRTQTDIVLIGGHYGIALAIGRTFVPSWPQDPFWNRSYDIRLMTIRLYSIYGYTTSGYSDEYLTIYSHIRGRLYIVFPRSWEPLCYICGLAFIVHR